MEANQEHLYQQFLTLPMSRLEDFLLASADHRERAFWRCLLDLRLQMEQEIVVKEDLL